MNRISVTMNVTLTNVSVYCIASKRTLLQWCITNTGHPSMFVEFFGEKYLLVTDNYIMVIPAHPHYVEVTHKMT